MNLLFCSVERPEKNQLPNLRKYRVLGLSFTSCQRREWTHLSMDPQAPLASFRGLLLDHTYVSYSNKQGMESAKKIQF